MSPKRDNQDQDAEVRERIEAMSKTEDDDSDAPVTLGDEGGEASPSGDIRADHVELTQGGAQNITATTVSITQGGAGNVRADSLSVSQGGVGLARTGQLTVEDGASAFAVLADDARVEEGANVFLVVGRSVSGGGVALDWRAAFALGAGIGFVLIFVRRLLR